jgi:hypothetical protein
MQRSHDLGSYSEVASRRFQVDYGELGSNSSFAATWMNRLYGEVILIATDGIVLALRLLLRHNSPQSSDKLLDKLDKFYEL